MDGNRAAPDHLELTLGLSLRVLEEKEESGG